MAKQRALSKPARYDADDFERLFLAADYARCREMLRTAPSSDRTTIQAGRLDLRDGHFLDAVERLTAMQASSPRAALERDVWLGAAHGATGDTAAAHRLLERALAKLQPPDELYYTAQYQRAFTYWQERKYDRLNEATAPLMKSEHPLYRGRARLLSSWVFAQRHDLRRQADEYLKALDDFDSLAQPDALVRLSTLFTLASLARELPLEDVAARVRSAYAQLVPTSGMRVQYFKITRVIGWLEALRGNELAAFRYFRSAAKLAPTPFWRVLCTSDRAYLAQTAGERTFALDQMYDAHEQASALSWHDAEQEDRMALLNLAELFAGVDPAIAQRYLALFRSLRTPMDHRMILASDPRVRAFEAYPSGMALLRLGETDAAKAMLTQAWDIYRKYDYSWRAALCALGLYNATGEARWLSQARAQAAFWPQSWVAREVRSVTEAHAAARHEAAVSPAQGHVLKLLLEGKRNAEIAAALKRSPNTVRNHIAEIFKIYGVKSRAALIARLSRKKP